MSPVLEVSNVGFSFGARKVLSGISFAVHPGRVTVLLGPNGAGKTTLFSLIARLLVPASGQILLEGTDLRSAPAQIMSSTGIIFQQPALELDLTVRQNLTYHASLHGMSTAERDAAMERVLSQMSLESRTKDKVRDLNGGHRRRVEIARALMTKPKLLLLDEPTVGLDIPTRQSLVAFLHELPERENMAILWATHLVDEVRNDDDLVVLADGKIQAAIPVSALLAQLGVGSVADAYGRLVTG